ncbi:TPA: hypothetical protein ACUUEN_005523 [Pseudomonas aeruginosa]
MSSDMVGTLYWILVGMSAASSAVYALESELQNLRKGLVFLVIFVISLVLVPFCEHFADGTQDHKDLGLSEWGLIYTTQILVFIAYIVRYEVLRRYNRSSTDGN